MMQGSTLATFTFFKVETVLSFVMLLVYCFAQAAILVLIKFYPNSIIISILAFIVGFSLTILILASLEQA